MKTETGKPSGKEPFDHLGAAMAKEKKQSVITARMFILVFISAALLIGFLESWLTSICIIVMIFSHHIVLRQHYIFVDRFPKSWK